MIQSRSDEEDELLLADAGGDEGGADAAGGGDYEHEEDAWGDAWDGTACKEEQSSPSLQGTGGRMPQQGAAARSGGRVALKAEQQQGAASLQSAQDRHQRLQKQDQ